jgi:ElaB/YqjD/DUF883 family membrane-anchored ribosome-binding protein
MPLPPDRRTVAERRADKTTERAEAEAAKPLQSRRTNSPAEAKREMERSRAEIEATLAAMKVKVAGEVDDAKDHLDQLRHRIDVPNRLRDKVRADPWRSLAIAAGVGLGLALLTSGKRGYETLTKDEIEEIRRFRKERRRHLVEIETMLERTARRNARPSLRDRIRARLSAMNDGE